jgi:carbon monoxide dehydrogenase subunit G
MISINQHAPVICSKEITIHAKSEKVWSVLTDIDHWADWQTDIGDPVLMGDLKEGTSFEWKTGGVRIHSTLHTVKAYTHFGWTGKTFGMFAIHNWTIAEDKGITMVHVDESMEGLLASLFKKSFNKNLEKGMQKWLELLKKVSENNTRSTDASGA